MPDLSLPGQPPPPLFFPPFPNEEKMRRGHLNAEAPLGLLGETHSVGRRKEFSHWIRTILKDFRSSTNGFAQTQRCRPSSWGKCLSARSSWAAAPIFRFGPGLEPGSVIIYWSPFARRANKYVWCSLLIELALQLHIPTISYTTLISQIHDVLRHSPREPSYNFDIILLE